MDHGEEKIVEEGQNREDEEGGFPTSLLRGHYSEEESARSFQEALRQWRGEKSGGAGEPMSEEAMWTPIRPGELQGNKHTYTQDKTGRGFMAQPGNK